MLVKDVIPLVHKIYLMDIVCGRSSWLNVGVHLLWSMAIKLQGLTAKTLRLR